MIFLDQHHSHFSFLQILAKPRIEILMKYLQGILGPTNWRQTFFYPCTAGRARIALIMQSYMRSKRLKKEGGGGIFLLNGGGMGWVRGIFTGISFGRFYQFEIFEGIWTMPPKIDLCMAWNVFQNIQNINIGVQCSRSLTVGLII